MDNANSSFSLRHRFFAFISIGLLVAVGTGVLVWKASTPAGTSSADAGPMIVSKTPHVVNASEEVSSTTQSADGSSSTNSSVTTKRPANRQDVEWQETNDPLLPPNAFIDDPNVPADTSGDTNGGDGEATPAPATGIQETTAEDGRVPESDYEPARPASPATTRPNSTRPTRTQNETTPQLTSEPALSSPNSTEPTEEPETTATTEPQEDNQTSEDQPEETTSIDSPTGVISETNGPLLPDLESTESTSAEPSTTRSSQPSA